MKKINLKRIVSLCLALVLGVSCLAAVGCAPADKPGDVLEISILESSGMTLTEAASGDYLSKTLTATVTTTSEDPLNKMVDWSVSWLDSTIEEDVANYVVVLPNYDGCNVAEVRCLAQFNNTVVVTCTTRVGGFKATCLVTYIGTPSEIEITSADELNLVEHSFDEGLMLYELEAGKDFTFDINLSNIFGPSTAGFAPNYTIAVECVKKIGYEVRGTSSMPTVSDLYTVEWEQPVYGSTLGAGNIGVVLNAHTVYGVPAISVVFANVSVLDNQVVVKSKAVPEAYSYSQTHTGFDFSRTFYRYGADAGPNYYVVTITETNTGLSTSFNFRTVSSVSDVSLDNTTLEF